MIQGSGPAFAAFGRLLEEGEGVVGLALALEAVGEADEELARARLLAQEVAVGEGGLAVAAGVAVGDGEEAAGALAHLAVGHAELELLGGGGPVASLAESALTYSRRSLELSG